MRLLLTTLILAAAATYAAEDRFDRTAAKLVQLVNNVDVDALFAMYNGEMQNALSASQIKVFMQGLLNQFGKIQKIESITRPSLETAVCRIQLERGVLNMQFTLTPDDKIAGMFFRPAPLDVSAAPDHHVTELSLPFKGEWLIFWGGDTPELGGHHLQAPGQRYAFDILGVGPDGKTRKGDGTRNEDYYAFGREILAPADGVVTDVITGVRDNRPGAMNPYSAVGNAVLIEHRPGEVSVLAHMKFGSIVVKPRDKVRKGQVVGLCGNSGNSSEPHLHYHLQNSTSLGDGVGIKIRFSSVKLTAGGKTGTKTLYSPVKGDIVSE